MRLGVEEFSGLGFQLIGTTITGVVNRAYYTVNDSSLHITPS